MASDASPAAVMASLASLPGVELVPGDVTDADSLRALLEGCSACLACHGARRTRKVSDLWQDATLDPAHSKNVNYLGVSNLIAAARGSSSCTHLIRVTGKGETPWALPSVLINGLGSMAKGFSATARYLRHLATAQWGARSAPRPRLPLRAASPASLSAPPLPPDPLPVHSPSHFLDSPSLQRGTTRVSSSCAAVSSTIRSYGRALWASLMSCPRPPSLSPTTVAPATCSCGPKSELRSPAAPGRRRGLLSADWLATDWLGHSAF